MRQEKEKLEVLLNPISSSFYFCFVFIALLFSEKNIIFLLGKLHDFSLERLLF